MIPRKCPRKTPFQHTVPPPPSVPRFRHPCTPNYVLNHNLSVSRSDLPFIEAWNNRQWWTNNSTKWVRTLIGGKTSLMPSLLSGPWTRTKQNRVEKSMPTRTRQVPPWSEIEIFIWKLYGQNRTYFVVITESVGFGFMGAVFKKITFHVCKIWIINKY